MKNYGTLRDDSEEILEKKETTEISLVRIPDKREEIVELTRELTYFGATKTFLELAVPYVGARFVSAFSEFIAVTMLSRIDETHLAASGIITVTNNFIITTAGISVYATGILQKIAAGSNPARVGNILNFSYLYATSIALLESVFLATAIKPLYTAFGLSSDVVDLTEEYYVALAFSAGLFGILNSVSSQQTAYVLGKPNLVLGVNVVRRALYLFFSYGLIYGKMGLPKCDIAGLAYAQSISSIFDQLAFLGYFIFDTKNRQKYSLLNSSLSGMSKEAYNFLKSAGSLAFQGVNEFLIGLFNIIAIGRISNSELAAAEIATQYNNILNIIILTASQSCAMQVGKYKAFLPDARKMVNAAMLSTMVVPLITIPLFLSIPDILAKPFDHSVIDAISSGDNLSTGNSDELSQDTVDLLLLIVAFNQIPSVVRQVCAGALRGLADFNTPMVVNLLSMTGVGVATSYLLGAVADMGAPGFFLGTTAGMTVSAATLLAVLIKKMYFNEKNVISDKSEKSELTSDTPLLSNICSRLVSFGCWSDENTETTKEEKQINHEYTNEREKDVDSKEDNASLCDRWCSYFSLKNMPLLSDCWDEKETKSFDMV